MDSQVSPKKSLFKRWWFWAIIVVIVIIVLAANRNSSGSYNQVPAVATAPESGACATSPSDLKREVQPVSYKELEKDTDSYNGQVATFTGQVLEIEQNGGSGIMRLSVTDLGDNIWSSNDAMYVTYEGTTTPVEDDIVTVTGTLTGSYTYTSEANLQITLPSMDTCGSNIHEASSHASDDTSSANVSTASVPVTTAPQTLATWHVAFTYTSSINDVANGGLVNTDPFTLKGARQKILLTCGPIFNLNGVGSSVSGNITGDNGFDIWGNDVQCPTTASYNEYLDPGQYHLSLQFTNATSTVTVEDYY